jgi:hypothetical protein
MEMRGKNLAPAALLPEKGPPVATEEVVGWAFSTGWSNWTRKKSVPAKELNPDSSAVQLVFLLLLLCVCLLSQAFPSRYVS